MNAIDESWPDLRICEELLHGRNGYPVRQRLGRLEEKKALRSAGFGEERVFGKETCMRYRSLARSLCFVLGAAVMQASNLHWLAPKPSRAAPMRVA